MSEPRSLNTKVKNFKLENAYDSHTHWLATGDFFSRLKLYDLKKSEDILNLNVLPEHKRGDWILGVGWDQNHWPGGQFPTREVLDKAFPENPVAFRRIDGHALWVNTEALKRADLFHRNPVSPDGGKVLVGEDDYPTGVLIDLALNKVENLIPEPTPFEVQKDLIKACEIFNQVGFTHIRDLTCSEMQWDEACRLYDRGQLTLAVEQFFNVDGQEDFHQVLNFAKKAQRHHPRLLRPTGIKAYYDGALGSEGAFLSEPYLGKKDRGLVLLERIALKEMMLMTWEEDLEFAVHTIGDEAGDVVASVAFELWEMGHRGVLNLEHAQLLRPETVKKLKDQTVKIHMQPSHWLSDKAWLSEKLSPRVFSFLFPWAELEKNDVLLYFGSDSPIESPSLFRTLEAINSAESGGIKSPERLPLEFHSHPDRSWAPETYTEIENNKIISVFFQGKALIN